MSENLKVNANSSVLEHKRKHNLLVEGLENGTLDLNVKTLEQKNVNWEYDNAVLSPTWLNGLIVDNIYLKCAVINKIMYIVMSGKVVNNTENTIYTGIGAITSFTIPTKYGDLIYRKNGTKISEVPGSGTTVVLFGNSYYRSSIGVATAKVLALSGENRNVIAIYDYSSTPVSAGGYLELEFRTYLLLD